jgi:polar amino acid transport system substrate-binding protein
MRTSDVPEGVKSELASAGTLRAAINLANSILVAQGGSDAGLGGIAPDVARELARRLDVPVRFVPYPSAAAAADDAGSGTWDVAFIGSDPAREDAVAFTAPYVELQSTYLVPAGSRLTSIADVDTAGVRIAARPRTAYDLVLRRTLKNATLVYPADTETDIDLVMTGRADALAGLRQVLEQASTSVPGSRVLDGEFAAIQQAIGVPRGRAAAAAYLEEFVADIKASGWLARAIEERGARGVAVAPE